MKQCLMFAAICAAMLLSSCSKDEGEGDLVINGVNVSGTWAVIGDVWDDSLYYDDNDEVCCTWQEGQKVDELIVFTPTTIRIYGPTDEWYDKWYDEGIYLNYGFVFSDGYMQGCSMSDFMEEDEVQFTVENGRLYASGIHIDLRFEGNDIVTWYDEGVAYQRYKRVKGFK